jgi:hypothetical protein
MIVASIAAQAEKSCAPHRFGAGLFSARADRAASNEGS